MLLALGARAAGGRGVGKADAVEVPLPDQPPVAVRIKLERFYPRVRAWYDAMEAQYLPLGRSLTAQEMDDARRLGVLQPRDVRVVLLDSFPMPEDMELREEARRHGLGSRTDVSGGLDVRFSGGQRALFGGVAAHRTGSAMPAALDRMALRLSNSRSAAICRRGVADWPVSGV